MEKSRNSRKGCLFLRLCKGKQLEYLLFSYPNCPQCEAVKLLLNQKNIEVNEFNLAARESKIKIREFLQVIKRDDKGGIIIPTLILQQAGELITVLNNQQELEDWLKSKG